MGATGERRPLCLMQAKPRAHAALNQKNPARLPLKRRMAQFFFTVKHRSSHELLRNLEAYCCILCV